MWQVVIEDDEAQRTTLDLAQGEYSIGRGEDNDVRLTERNVSRRHAVMRMTTEGWQLNDGGSYNGTFVNGERIGAEGVLLSAGDVVNIGDYRLELLDAAAQQAAAQEAEKQRRPDRLVVVIGPQPGIEFALQGDRLVVGRAEDATIPINHASVSRYHAELVSLGQNRWEVVDQGSSNGMRINGVELRRGIIEPGDALELGDVRLRFVAAGKFFRPVVDLSQALPAMGMTTTPESSTPRSIGTIAAVLAVVAALGVGGAVMFSGSGNAVSADSPVAETDEQAQAFLDRAIEAAGEGDLDTAHTLLGKIPESSRIRDDPEYKRIEDDWADYMFGKAEAEQDREAKRTILVAVADTTTVSVEKRKTANEKLRELGFEPSKSVPAPRPTVTATATAPKPKPKRDIYEGLDDNKTASNTPPQPGSKPGPKAPPPKFNENAEKQRLMGKAASGTATETELRMLKAICMNDGDRQCRNMAVSGLNNKKK